MILDRDPRLTAPKFLPRHRILRVLVRNDAAGPVALRGDEIALRDDDGTDLRASVTPRAQTVAPGAVAGLDLVYVRRAGTGVPARLLIAGEALPVDAAHQVGQHDGLA